MYSNIMLTVIVTLYRYIQLYILYAEFMYVCVCMCGQSKVCIYFNMLINLTITHQRQPIYSNL